MRPTADPQRLWGGPDPGRGTGHQRPESVGVLWAGRDLPRAERATNSTPLSQAYSVLSPSYKGLPKFPSVPGLPQKPRGEREGGRQAGKLGLSSPEPRGGKAAAGTAGGKFLRLLPGAEWGGGGGPKGRPRPAPGRGPLPAAPCEGAAPPPFPARRSMARRGREGGGDSGGCPCWGGGCPQGAVREVNGEGFGSSKMAARDAEGGGGRASVGSATRLPLEASEARVKPFSRDRPLSRAFGGQKWGFGPKYVVVSEQGGGRGLVLPAGASWSCLPWAVHAEN